MDSEADYSPQRLADRARITDVLHQYCTGVDRLDMELVRDSFHPDAHDDHSIYSGGVQGLIDWISDRHRGIRFSMHATTNVTIEFTQQDTALVESYIHSAQRMSANDATSSAERTVITFARYVDVFTRRGGQWRIQHRTAIFDDMWQAPIAQGAPVLGETWIRGVRTPADPAYALRGRIRAGQLPFLAPKTNEDDNHANL